MLAEGARRWPEHGVGSITVNAPGTSRAVVELREGGGMSLINRGQSETLRFDGVTGQLQASPEAPAISWVRATSNVITGVHLGRFAEPATRWLLLLSGVVGTFMAASGMVLWVVKRMPEIADKVTDGKWEKLVEPCAQAYPVAATAQPELPRDPLVAGLGCDMLRQFVGRALASDGRYEETLTQYCALERKLDGKLAPLMARQGIDNGTEGTEQKRKAMSTVAKLGNPTAVMDACVQRYI